MKSTYYISTGRLNKMYTLRHEEPQYRRDERGQVHQEGVYDYYICTLAHDLESAKEKASERVGYVPEVRAESALADISAPTERCPETIYFGKYDGRHFTVMDEDYAVFVYNNMSRQVFPEFWENVYNHFKDAIDEEAKKRAAAERAEKEKARLREEHIEKTEWVGKIGGERIKVTAVITDSFGFSGTFGWTNITKLVDDDGNYYLYWNSLSNKEDYAEEGDRVEFMARVKDHTYDRDEARMKVTVLSRATKVKIFKKEEVA